MTEPRDLDPLDLEILSRLRSVHERLDPPPPLLDELVSFSLGAAQLDTEVARLVERESEVLARGDERTRSLTFTADGLTVLLTIADAGSDRVRLDGWISPAGQLAVEVRLQGPGPGPATVQSEPTGRFVLPAVPRRAAQLVLRSAARTVITPAFRL